MVKRRRRNATSTKRSYTRRAPLAKRGGRGPQKGPTLRKRVEQLELRLAALTMQQVANVIERPIPWPDPTPAMLDDSRFNAIWSVIKSWDIHVPGAYVGYCGASGNHVRAILDAIPRRTMFDELAPAAKPVAPATQIVSTDAIVQGEVKQPATVEELETTDGTVSGNPKPAAREAA